MNAKPACRVRHFCAALSVATVATLLLGLWQSPAQNFYQIQLQPGWNAIANQLSRGDNTLATVLPQAPPNAQFYHFDSATQDYIVSNFDSTNGVWDNPTIPFGPGEGGLLYHPTGTPYTLTFVGQSITPQLPLSLPPSKLVLVASQVPAPATYEQITGQAPTNGTQLYRFTSVIQTNVPSLTNWIPYAFTQSNWIPSTPSVEIGEPVFIQLPAPPPPPPQLFKPIIFTTNVLLSWTATLNTSYRLEYTPALSFPDWHPVPGDVLSQSNIASKIDELAPGNRYYRVRVIQ